MEQPPSEVTFRRRLGRDRGENFSLPYGVADCAAPPVSKRRLRSGPNLHPGDTHHCADGLFARDKHLVHDSANARSLVLFLARPRAGAAGVETCMKVVSVIAQKGGAGKTTLSVALACTAAAVRLSAVIVDLDPQATAASWADRRDSESPAVISAQPPRLARILGAAGTQAVDLAVIDTAPRVEQSAVAAAKAADLVLIPTRTAVYDLETVVTTVELIRAVRRDVPLLCVLNGAPPRGPRQQQARDLPSRHRCPRLPGQPWPSCGDRLRRGPRHECPRVRANRQGRNGNRCGLLF